MTPPPDDTDQGPHGDLTALRIDRTPRSARRRRGGGWTKWLVLLAVVVGTGWLFQRQLTGLVDRVRLPEVELARIVERSPVAATAISGAAANGYIVARVRAALSADTPGRIVEMNVVEGMLVKRGDVVARLYSEEYEAAFQRAEAEFVLAEAGLRRAEAQRVSAEADLGRLASLVEAREAATREARSALALTESDYARFAELVAKGYESAQRLDQISAERDGAKARVETATADLAAARAASTQGGSAVVVARAAEEEGRARIEVARANRGQAQATLAKTYVRAPFDGIVVQKDAEVGEVVSPNSQGGGQARGSVATMVDLSTLEVQANVPETNLAAVRIGEPARIFLDAFPGRPYAGRIDRIWPAADRQKATVEVRIAFDQLDDRLRPEMGVRVVFLDAEPDPAAVSDGAAAETVLLVPTRCVVSVAGARGVFAVERDVAAFLPLDLGEVRGTNTLVRSGAAADTSVILDPPADLKDGDRVRVPAS